MRKIKLLVKEIHYRTYHFSADIQNIDEAVQAVKNCDESKFTIGEFEYSHITDEDEWIIVEEIDGQETGRFKMINDEIVDSRI